MHLVFSFLFLLGPGLISAAPAANSSSASVPTRVTLTFSTPLLRSYPDPISYLQVYGPGGNEVSRGDATVGVDRMSIKINTSQQKRGTYIVHWHVVFDSLDEKNGNFAFFVGNPAQSDDDDDLPSILGILCFLSVSIVFIDIATMMTLILLFKSKIYTT